MQVTPDGQRTMRTALGAAAGLVGVDQLPQGWLQGAGMLHMEGYVMYRPALAKGALRAAKDQGAMVRRTPPPSVSASHLFFNT